MENTKAALFVVNLSVCEHWTKHKELLLVQSDLEHIFPFTGAEIKIKTSGIPSFRVCEP
jgi:hypothetical protein